MRVAHLGTADIGGGAANAGYSLHSGLRKTGIDSSMLVLQRTSDDPSVTRFDPPSSPRLRATRLLRAKQIAGTSRRYRDRPSNASFFSDDRTVFGTSILAQLPPHDVVNLHWVADLVDYRRVLPPLSRMSPVVWTLHDMNPFTGGCHFDLGCGRFQARCGSCPQLGSSDETDLSRQIWRRKERALRAMQSVHIVTPSRWLRDEVKRSSLMGRFDVSVIPYGMDTEAWVPGDPSAARKVLQIPPDRPTILFSGLPANDWRKGGSLLQEALDTLDPELAPILLTAGSGTIGFENIEHIHLGLLNGAKEQALAYRAADICVVPSRQDNLPLTVIEAFACGTPVVGFAVGGIPEMVRHGETGFLATAEDPKTLASSIAEALSDHHRLQEMSRRCRDTAEDRFSSARQAADYIFLYRGLIEQFRARTSTKIGTR